jgi:hypothetical protein
MSSDSLIVPHINGTLEQMADRLEFRFMFRKRVAEAILRFNVPYCLHPIQGNDDVLIALNREYKPLGYPNYDHRVDYRLYPQYMIPISGLNMKDLRSVADSFTPSQDSYWFFYDDSNPPWFDKKCFCKYLEKLVAVFPEVAKVARWWL